MKNNQGLFLKIYLAFTGTFIGLGILFMLFDMVNAYSDVISRSGVTGLLSHGVFYHKIGELIFALTVVYILFSSFTKAQESLIQKIKWSRILILLGGFLNMVSWIAYQGKIATNDFMYYYTIVLFIASVIMALIIKRLCLLISNKYTANSK